MDETGSYIIEFSGRIEVQTSKDIDQVDLSFRRYWAWGIARACEIEMRSYPSIHSVDTKIEIQTVRNEEKSK